MKIVTLFAAAAAAAAVMFASAPAMADPAPYFTGGSCDQTDANGPGWSGGFECQLYWAGGTGTVNIQVFTGNYYTSPHIDDSGPGFADVSGFCNTAGPGVDVLAKLTDSAGATASEHFYTSCHM